MPQTTHISRPRTDIRKPRVHERKKGAPADRKTPTIKQEFDGVDGFLGYLKYAMDQNIDPQIVFDRLKRAATEFSDDELSDGLIYRKLANWARKLETPEADLIAEWALERAYEENNDNKVFMEKLGCLFTDHGCYEDAEECYAEIALIDGRYTGRNLKRLGVMYNAWGFDDLALACFTKAIDEGAKLSDTVAQIHCDTKARLGRAYDESMWNDVQQRLEPIIEQLRHADLDPVTARNVGQYDDGQVVDWDALIREPV